MQREIVQADPAARRKAVLVAIGLVGALSMAAAAAPRMFGNLGALSQASPAEAVLLLAAFVTPLVALVVVAALDAIRRSLATLRERRFPPRGMPVLRDTPVVEGGVARVLGVLGCALGATLLVLALALAVTSYQIGRVLWFGCPRAADASTSI